MSGMVKADVILQQLSAEYGRSKVEQIEQFLRDQHDLTETFSRLAAADDGDDGGDGSDSSDTETVFELRMATYRGRPRLAFVESGELGSGDSLCAPVIRRPACDVEMRARGMRQHTAIPNKTPSNKPQAAVNSEALAKTINKFAPRSIATDVKKDLQPDDVARETPARLLSKRRGRPNTATGVGRLHEESGIGLRADPGLVAGAKATPAAKRQQRSSAPAGCSRIGRVSRDVIPVLGRYVPARDEAVDMSAQDRHATPARHEPYASGNGALTLENTQPVNAARLAALPQSNRNERRNGIRAITNHLFRFVEDRSAGFVSNTPTVAVKLPSLLRDGRGTQQNNDKSSFPICKWQHA